MITRREQKEKARRLRIEGEQARVQQLAAEAARQSREHATQAWTSPAAWLIYELMRRGSVLPSTMEQVASRVREGEVKVERQQDEELLQKAREIYATLPWMGEG